MFHPEANWPLRRNHSLSLFSDSSRSGLLLARAYSLNTEGNGMGIIGTIFIGLIVGLLARFLKPGDDSMGWIMTIVLGIAGSLAATYGGQALGIYQAGEGAGFLGALVGAIILLVIYGMIKKK
ncbi:Transglycosylase [Pseudomonas syringae]|nr:Transglycosylase [Pseudomonas syringae]